MVLLIHLVSKVLHQEFFTIYDLFYYKFMKRKSSLLNSVWKHNFHYSVQLIFFIIK